MRNHKFALFLGTFVSLVTFPALAASMLSASVTSVVDGDTLRVRALNPVDDWSPASLFANPSWANADLKIRMISIDAPESHLQIESGGMASQGHWADEATRALSNLIGPQMRVEIESFGKDKYGRILGKVFVHKNDVHLELVRQGLVATYFICAEKECPSDYMDVHELFAFADACEYAKSRGLGIWNPADPLPELPFEFRLRMQKRKPERFVGNMRTKRLYQPEQYDQVGPCERLFFNAVADAERLGFKF